ncbi:MAG: S-adenosylmethionine:tRNA ribosyltransferase-isomerase [Euzebya sp.]
MTAATQPRPTVTFEVPPDRWAMEPPEARDVPRDQVRLLVASPGHTAHVRFADLDRFLRPGDAVVINTSATRPAAIQATHVSGPAVVHMSTEHPDGSWTVELRRPDGSGPILDAGPGDVIALDGGGHVRLGSPSAAGPDGRGVRLWRASVTVSGRVSAHLRDHGRPITYGPQRFPLSDYQTVFARHPGSAEMPSAGRPFSAGLVTRLVARGIAVLPITLHAGVSSQDAGEAPQPEWFDVPAYTAAHLNLTRRLGGRVIAVGTTVTRALESAVEGQTVIARREWTDLLITPERGVMIIQGLITGWHEPQASHLQLLQAVAGTALVQHAYEEAVAGPYLWHEFGDSCLLLP